MKLIKQFILLSALLVLVGCSKYMTLPRFSMPNFGFITNKMSLPNLDLLQSNSEKSNYNSQKVIQSVNSLYPDETTNLIYIGAPEGFIAPREVNNEVSSGVDDGKVWAIISALAVKTSTVVITGNNEDLNVATIARALATGDERISGSKIIVYVGSKKYIPYLKAKANNAGVNIRFMGLSS